MIHREFIHGHHTPAEFLKLRTEIRSFHDEAKIPQKRTWVYTDLFSFACHDKRARALILLPDREMPSDDDLEMYYNEVICWGVYP